MSSIRITRRDLETAAEGGLLREEDIDPLWRHLAERTSAGDAPVFNTVHLLWYVGALIVMAAMGLFTTIGFLSFGNGFLLTVALLYMAGFALAGRRVIGQPGLRTVGGLLFAVAVSMVPLATFAVQDLLGWWSNDWPGPEAGFVEYLCGSSIPMGTATAFIGTLVFRSIRFPFLLMPVSVALWLMSQDLGNWLLGDGGSLTFRSGIAAIMGSVICLLAWIVDLRDERGSAFWLHLSGALSLWAGITALDNGDEIARAGYALFNVALLALSVFLGRRVYAALGAIGVVLYLGYLANAVFEDSLLFPFALSLIGVAVIMAGIALQRRLPALQAWMGRRLPPSAKALRPPHAR
ncbi:hypothetical protein [Azospirillum sp. SYSU D00513]|uniref:hypothetical protein n=1 Tax=Azospirillum sp. SYSU D00513 TaxID=2812561 RepID=UPI001A960FAB|nr:hypothetical protein [Azospirillum sp. SYSU D00513]